MKVVFSYFGYVDYFRETKIRFSAAILKRNFFFSFWFLFYLLLYGYLRCIQAWCKFRTKIPAEMYFENGWFQVDPPCAQTGVKIA